jgi:Ni,Fe-hydrogenase III large subunit
MALESLAELRDSRSAPSGCARLLLERERVANHLGDLGALGNDAAFAFGLAQFSRLREDWLRLAKEAFGHRLMMDCIVPGGVSSDIEHAPAPTAFSVSATASSAKYCRLQPGVRRAFRPAGSLHDHWPRDA